MKVKSHTGEMGIMQRYQVTNWSEFDRSLVNRGNPTIWFDDVAIQQQWTPRAPAGRGNFGLNSESAMQARLTTKTSFQLPCRVTEGLINALMRACHFDLPMEDHMHVSRWVDQLSVKMLCQRSRGPMHAVPDSTGRKIFGEGEWAVSQPDGGKCHTWRKGHRAEDETSKGIVGIGVAMTAWGDSEILLDHVEGKLGQVSTDGSYDSDGFHAVSTKTGFASHHAVTRRCGHGRDDQHHDGIIQETEAKGLDGEKNDSGYDRRSIVEKMIYRSKQLGDSLFAPTFERRPNVAHVRVAITNTFAYLGMLQPVCGEQVVPAA